MTDANIALPRRSIPAPGAVAELLKPVTWFAPMWAFMCGAVSSGVSLTENWLLVLAGMTLAGPFVCGSSQAANDWFDRHVDAINEPGRPIPSGRVPGRSGFYVALIGSGLSLLLGWALGPWAFAASAVALAIGWAYSAPPFRWKADGWLGPFSCGLAYEGLAWVTGAAVLLQAAPRAEIFALAGLYSIGALGIMILNDFKALEGDRATGVRSLPAVLGPERAARIACVVMIVPQVVVILGLAVYGRPIHAGVVAALLAVQLVLMRTLLSDPKTKTPWYASTGVTLFVFGMLASALAARPVAGL